MTAGVRPRFAGVVLTGGGSTRMGTDKAFLELPGMGKPLAAVSRDALRDAGAVAVHSIGGDVGRLQALGFDAHADEFPGEGPLGGIVGAFAVVHAGHRSHGEDVDCVVVLTCDLPAIDGDAVSRLVATLRADHRCDAAMPTRDGRRQILTAAYRIGAAPTFRAAFLAGERSVRRVVAQLQVCTVEGIEAEVLLDVDRPDDLDRWTGRPAE